MNNTRAAKQDIINRLYNAKGTLIRQVDSSEYATTCPYCAHTSNSPFKLRFYLHIDIESDEAIAAKCFRCTFKTKNMKYDTLEALLGQQDLALKQAMDSMSYTSVSSDKMNNFIKKKADMNIKYNYKLPKAKYGKKIKYLEERIGIKLTSELCRRLKIVTSLREFLKLNNTGIDKKDRDICLMLEENFVGFLSMSNTYILFRDITEKNKIRWFKYRIDKKLPKGTPVYTIESSVDIFTRDNIHVNISEGTLDIASVYLNMGYIDEDNVINMAMTGKQYKPVINHIISRGIVGGNVILNIWSDADHRYDNTVHDTTLEYYKKHLNKYVYLFKEVNIIYNAKKKDFGYSIDDIIIEKHKL